MKVILLYQCTSDICLLSFCTISLLISSLSLINFVACFSSLNNFVKIKFDLTNTKVAPDYFLYMYTLLIVDKFVEREIYVRKVCYLSFFYCDQHKISSVLGLGFQKDLEISMFCPNIRWWILVILLSNTALKNICLLSLNFSKGVMIPDKYSS